MMAGIFGLSEFYINFVKFGQTMKGFRPSLYENHPLIQRCVALGGKPFGSPTLSDQALMPFPSFKLGPGDSARSHTADEFICLSELDVALEFYIKLLSH